MAEPHVAPFGSWRSPITSDLIVADSIRLGDIHLDGADIYWIEGRPAEAGRCVIVRRTPDGTTSDVTPAPFNARTRVHEYGGAPYVVMGGTIFFSNYADQRLYRQPAGQQPEPVTPAADLRYADATIDRPRRRLICVREDHTDPGREAVNTIVGVGRDAEAGGQLLVSGNDFYSTPRVSPDGTRLAWLTWNHPNMPWDGCELWVGELREDGSVGASTLVAGGPEESIFQPEWSPDGVLHFVSDRTGWWNLYRWHEGRVQPLCPMEAEFGVPQWVFGLSTYAFESAQRIICSYVRGTTWRLAALDTASLHLEPIEMPYTTIQGVRAGPGYAVFEAGSPGEPLSTVRYDVSTGAMEVLRRSSNVAVEAGYLSSPREIEFPTENGLTAHGVYYPARNRDYVAPDGEKPPLLVKSHGGPTGSTETVLDLEIQYWTSRGIAVLDVNYGGSTGYGRAYRQRLNGRWGIVDVDDCANGARYLVQSGEVDGERLAIDGGSAGGYTTLCALTFRDAFKAGASYYGISDLEAMARDTHKFESRYLDRLVGPYPERRDLYIERSPIHFVERISCPMILLQGLEDKVVPPNQAEMMVEALRARGVPVAYLAFEGEQHGFRQAANIKRALDAELYFYSRIFGFELADAVTPVEIR